MQNAAVLRPESGRPFLQLFKVPAVSLGNPVHLCKYLPGPGGNFDQQLFKELKNYLKTVLACKLAKIEQFKDFVN